jgi:hypothetical protein
MATKKKSEKVETKEDGGKVASVHVRFSSWDTYRTLAQFGLGHTPPKSATQVATEALEAYAKTLDVKAKK